MDKEAILVEFIKETRQNIREIQARVYNLSTTFVVASFAITAYVWEKLKTLTIPITLFSDLMIVAVLIYLYFRIYNEHKLVRLALEKQEQVLINLLDGQKVAAQDMVAPLLDLNAKPALSITYEVNLFLWAAAIIFLKALLVVIVYS